jgi:signal peptidase I
VTAQQLLILIGILAVLRGVFFAFPRMTVRSTPLKVALLIGLAAACYYLFHNEFLQRMPEYARIVVPIILGIAIIVGIPAGDFDETQKKTLLEYVDSVIIAGLTALILIWFVVRSFYIPSESMVQTLQIDDMILVDELVYRFYKPARGDIIVFHPPPAAHSGDKDFIKRIVAVGGDTIEVKDDHVILNGVPQNEPYAYIKKGEFPSPLADMPPEKIEPGNVFVMGDNRENSDDSRAWQQLPEKNIIGKAFLIFYPPRRMGRLR